MKWIAAFVLCSVLNGSFAAPQGTLTDDDGIYDDFMKEMMGDDSARVRRDDGRTMMDILTGKVGRGDVTDDVVRVARSVDDPMLISAGPQPCQARDAGPFDGPYQQQYFNPNGQQADPKTHKLPVLPMGGHGHGGGGGGGALIVGHESFLEPVHKENIYYASIPFISGYKMTPIIHNKKVIVKDLPGHEGLGHGGLGLGGLGGLGHSGLGLEGLGSLGGGGLLHDGGLPGVPGLPFLPLGGLPPGLSLGATHSSRSSRPDYATQAAYPTHEDYPCPADLDESFFQSGSSDPQDFYIADPGTRHPLDLNIFFETPEAAAARDANPELLTPDTYVDAIRNLQQQMDHLHSLKLAQERQYQPDEANFV